jgi:glucose/arabinose dehydrogenase
VPTFLRSLAAGAVLAASAISFAAPGPVVLAPFVSGLASPVEITHAGDGSGRLFVVEQPGRIRIVKNGKLLAQPFLDLSGIVQFGGEQGLLGLAFHPDYAANGYFYVYYNKPPANAPAGGSDIVIARYARSGSNADVANSQSGQVLLTIAHPQQTNHNGGKLAFGRDRYLYVGVGDGGGGGDPFGAGQNLNDLRAKILRIDVNGTAPYAIPPTNPFVNLPGKRAEIFAYGVRNPWRFSFDRLTGDLFIGDVGQNAWEEIDYIPFGSNGGQNLGWNVYEGTHCYSPSSGCSLAGHVPPILEYGHDANGGFAVTGGYRYRGRRVQEIYGYYIYGDYVSGHVWAASPGTGGAWSTTLLNVTASNVSAFGEDEEGDLYAANLSAGTITRFMPVDSDGDGMSDAWEMQYFGSATGADPAADSDGDGIPNAIEYLERRNPLVKDNDVFTDSRLFTMQQYRDFLGREGDGPGIRGWTALLDAGTASRTQVIDSFVASAEFAGFVAPVVRLYFACFQRVPDYAGLTFNAGLVRNGMVTLTQLASFFATSPEFIATYGSLDNTQFVTLLYRSVLGRAPDAAGLAGWVSLLNGGASRGQVVLGFSDSTEFQALIGNEVFATMMYAGMLRRTPEPAGFSGWVGLLDAGTPRSAVIDGFFLSTEYRSRFLP